MDSSTACAAAAPKFSTGASKLVVEVSHGWVGGIWGQIRGGLGWLLVAPACSSSYRFCSALFLSLDIKQQDGWHQSEDPIGSLLGSNLKIFLISCKLSDHTPTIDAAHIPIKWLPQHQWCRIGLGCWSPQNAAIF